MIFQLGISFGLLTAMLVLGTAQNFGSPVAASIVGVVAVAVLAYVARAVSR